MALRGLAMVFGSGADAGGRSSVTCIAAGSGDLLGLGRATSIARADSKRMWMAAEATPIAMVRLTLDRPISSRPLPPGSTVGKMEAALWQDARTSRRDNQAESSQFVPIVHGRWTRRGAVVVDWREGLRRSAVVTGRAYLIASIILIGASAYEHGYALRRHIRITWQGRSSDVVVFTDAEGRSQSIDCAAPDSSPPPKSALGSRGALTLANQSRVSKGRGIGVPLSSTGGVRWSIWRLLTRSAGPSSVGCVGRLCGSSPAQRAN